MLGNSVSLHRVNLSLQKSLDLANLYLRNAWDSTDAEITLVLCHDTKDALSQAKKVARRTGDRSMDALIATTHIDLGGLLERQGHRDEAMHSARRPESGGVQLVNQSSTSPNQREQESTVTVPSNIFPTNVPPPSIDFKPPEPDARLNDTPQLACCLGLLQADCEPGDILDTNTRNWLQATKDEPDEKDRLGKLATDVIRAFKRDEFKDAKAVAEVVHLAPVLGNDDFRYLVKEFYSGIDQSGLLDVHQLEGLAHLVQGAHSGYLNADDLVKILELLSTRLRDTHQQSTSHFNQLILVVSHVLDAMADTEVKGVDRKKIHEPLSSYLDRLKGSSDPYLVYQAAYAYQALLRVPDDELLWQATMRRTGKVVQGVAGLVSAMRGLDLNRFVESLRDIQRGLPGASEMLDIVRNTYNAVTFLTESGQGFLDCLKEGFSFSRQCAWYTALRGADVLIRDGQFAEFRKLICEAPCRRDVAFQWGVCQRLGEIASNSKWDFVVRESAIAFFGEIYRNDTAWEHQSTIKQWILNILMQLSSQSGSGKQSAKALLQELQNDGDDKKQALYRECLENGPGNYPLKVALPSIASPSLLDLVQERPDVEGQIRQLRRQRLKEQGNAVYIQPQAIDNLQSRDDKRFSLMEKVEKFLDGDQKVFLLLGESGAGKSTFNRELERHSWETYKKGGTIPLHINLPAIDKPENEIVAKQLRKAEFTEPQIRELKFHRKFILICDGYDESQQIRNLYTSNRLNQQGEWNAKMVISCRSEYIGTDYRDRFQPGDRNSRPDPGLFQEAVITPFSTGQIQEYITQYVRIHRPLWKADEYQKTLGLIPSLKELVTNPFLMSLSLEVLPRMVDPGQDLSATRITRVALYDQFIEHWLERGKKRLGEKNMGPLARSAFESLVDEGFTRNGIDYLKRLSVAIYREQNSHPIVRYSRYNDEGSWKSNFFSREDEKQLLREACPLVRNGNQHRFIHRSLLEYGVSLAVFDPQDWKERMAPESALGRRGSIASMLSCDGDPMEELTTTIQQEPDFNSPLAWRGFTKEPSVLQFLEERAQQESLFKQQLLDYIEHSKSDKKWRTAASNAITILVRSGMQFNGADLRGIRIPGADISNGTFDSAQLQGADLRHADLRGVWLKRANLSDAEMTHVQFGEQAYLRQDDEVDRCLYSPDGKSIAVKVKGDILVYSTSTWERMRTLGNCGNHRQGVVYSPKGDELAIGSNGNILMRWRIEMGDCLDTLRGHIGIVTSIAYSPQGNQIASASRDRTLKLWDVETGDCLHTLTGHTSIVNCVVYSPTGRQVASGSKDWTVRLWDVETGDCLHTLTGHTSVVNCVVYSPTGRQVASGSEDCTVRLWDVETGECSRTLHGHKKPIETIVYSPQGDRIASIEQFHYKCSARLWEVANGVCILPIAGTGKDSPFAFSPKGNQVASTQYHQVLLWDAKTGNSLHTLEDRSNVSAIVYSPQGDLLASTGDDSTIRLWDVETGACLRMLTGHSKGITSVVFSPKGDRIVSSSPDMTVRLWDVEFRTSRRTSSGHNVSVHMVKCSPKGDQFASCSDDMTVRLWDVETGTCQHILRNQTRCVEYSPQGHQIATCSRDRTVRLWDVHTGGCTHTLIGHSDQVNKVAYSPQGNQLASCGVDRTVRLWDVGSGECLHILTGHTSPICDVVYSPNGKQITTCSQDATRLWDITTGAYKDILSAFIRGQSATYSPRGDQIAILSPINLVLWDMKKHGKKVLSQYQLAAFSPNGKQIATVNRSNYGIELMDAKKRVCLQTLSGHEEMVTCIVYSHRGDLVVSASKNNSVRLWDSASGQCRAVIQDFHHSIKDIAWVEAPNSSYVVAGCDDGVVGMWKVVIDGDRCQVRLHWRTSNGELEAAGAVIQDVQGLSSRNMKILKESRAVEKLAHYPSEATIRLAWSPSPNTRARRDRSEGEVFDPVSPSSMFHVKRVLKLDEEDEGVIKGACGSGASDM